MMFELLSHEECTNVAFDHKIALREISPTDDSDLDYSIFQPNVKTNVTPASECRHGMLCCCSCICSDMGCRSNDRVLSPSKALRRICSCKSPVRHCSRRITLLKYLFYLSCLLFLLGIGIFYTSWQLNRTVVKQKTRLLQHLVKLKNIGLSRSLNAHRYNDKSSLGKPFDPEQWTNQSANTKHQYLILYWSKIRGHKARIQQKKEYEKDNHIWPYTYAGNGDCPVSCKLTNDRSRAQEASAFVVHSRLTDVWDFPPLKHLAPWILQNNENPVYTPALSDPRIMNKFNLLISYRLDSDFPSPIYPMPTMSKPIPFKERLGGVLAVFSKCELVRTEYMRQLMKFIPVHSYGACLKTKAGLIGLYGQANGKYVFKDYKLVLTRFYKFSLVFMNQDCDYFVDDRLYHALESGSIPVYMGTDKIAEFLPGSLKNAIIKVSDFSTPEQLADYLKYLSNNETAYNEYLEWKTTGFGNMSNTTIGRWWHQKYPLFCQVCMRLSQGNLHKGLDIDTCKPRQYQDWNLKPPYGIDSTVVTDNPGGGSKDKKNRHNWNVLMLTICMVLAVYCTVSVYRIYSFLNNK